MTDFQTVKVSDLNQTRIQRAANLEVKADINNVSSLFVSKFTVKKNFPVHIPKLTIYDDTISNVANYTNKTANLDPNYTIIQYKMESAVMVEHISGNSYCCCNVRYISNRNAQKPPSFNIGDQSLARSITLNDEYFYMYSTPELTRMITKTIQECLKALGVPFQETDIYLGLTSNGRYQMYVSPPLGKDINIYFNYELKSMFPFDFISKGLSDNNFQQLFLDKQFVTETANGHFITAETLRCSSSIFPFNNMIFSTNNLPVQTIISCNSALVNQQYNNKVTEIYSFSLNLTKPDSQNELFEFVLPSLISVLKLTNHTPNVFNLFIYLQTADGYNVQLKLDKDEFVEMNLMLV